MPTIRTGRRWPGRGHCVLNLIANREALIARVLVRGQVPVQAYLVAAWHLFHNRSEVLHRVRRRGFAARRTRGRGVGNIARRGRRPPGVDCGYPVTILGVRIQPLVLIRLGALAIGVDRNGVAFTFASGVAGVAVLILTRTGSAAVWKRTKRRSRRRHADKPTRDVGVAGVHRRVPGQVDLAVADRRGGQVVGHPGKGVGDADGLYVVRQRRQSGAGGVDGEHPVVTRIIRIKFVRVGVGHHAVIIHHDFGFGDFHLLGHPHVGVVRGVDAVAVYRSRRVLPAQLDHGAALLIDFQVGHRAGQINVVRLRAVGRQRREQGQRANDG